MSGLYRTPRRVTRHALLPQYCYALRTYLVRFAGIAVERATRAKTGRDA
jgi:hypothetical protein